MKFFGYFDLGQQGFEFVAFPGAIEPGFRGVHQEAPVIGSSAGSGVELIDPMFLSLLRHGGSPSSV
jgi:hypothetical protein